MRSSRAKSIARQISMLGILAIVVTGLTFLFNLFATIGVSVLAGMMAGASRRWNWQVISVSFLPPIVAVTLGYFTKAPIDTQRGLYLTGICLGAFWGTWLATFFLMSLEAKSGAAAGQEITPVTIAAESPAERRPVTELVRDRGPNGARVNGDAWAHFHLDDLEGTWRRDTTSADERLLVVAHGKFSLSTVDASGQAHVIAQGELVPQPQSESGNELLLISTRIDGPPGKDRRV